MTEFNQQPQSLGYANPSAGFAAAAAPGLTDAAARVSEMNDAVESGDLVLDDDTAPAVLAALTRLSARVDRLVADAPNLDAPLLLGNSWVAGVMASRLQDAASGPEGAAIGVLTEFQRLIHEFEQTVRKAVHIQQAVDAEAKEELDRISTSVEGGGLR